jgi:hypothetical protein
MRGGDVFRAPEEPAEFDIFDNDSEANLFAVPMSQLTLPSDRKVAPGGIMHLIDPGDVALGFELRSCRAAGPVCCRLLDARLSYPSFSKVRVWACMARH